MPIVSIFIALFGKLMADGHNAANKKDMNNEKFMQNPQGLPPEQLNAAYFNEFKRQFASGALPMNWEPNTHIYA